MVACISGPGVCLLQSADLMADALRQVEAEANTVSRPLPGFTPRKGKGLPLFGKSESTPPSSPASPNLTSGAVHCMASAVKQHPHRFVKCQDCAGLLAMSSLSNPALCQSFSEGPQSSYGAPDKVLCHQPHCVSCTMVISIGGPC